MSKHPAPCTVWIVEDSPLEAEVARRALAPAFDVEVFVDGTSMLERLASGAPPHVLMLDWRLPNLSGIEACRFVRGQFDEMSLPILILTVHSDKADVVEGLTAGANDYLTKPYDPTELVARVTSLYRTRKLSDDLRSERAQLHELLSSQVEARRQAAIAHAERLVLLAEAQTASARAEEANRAKDEFLATVSHELRTPLNAILGWVTLLRGGNLPPDRVSQALATIDRNVRAQSQLIDDLLDVSRIISGKLSLLMEPTDLVEVVRAAVEAVRPAAADKNIEIRTEVFGIEAPAMGDASRLEQVVWNLLSNALKFTPPGGHVTVTIEKGETHNSLSVSDDGEGIPEAALPFIFDRFRQAESSITRSHGGLGLGLAIVRHLVELHAGSITAHSAGSGKGSTFKVVLPRTNETRTKPPPRRGSSTQLVAPNRLVGVRVLLVEDDADGREVIATLLRHQGAQVETASSARAALAALDVAVPDVLLSDIGMPDEDGLSLLRKVRARDVTAGGDVPALALTAFARAEDRAQSELAGFNDFLAKPVESVELIRAIATLTGRPWSEEQP
jgi:signal transduction histidine kinase